MPIPDVEVAVVGGGAMGSAAAWHLAERGREVVLVEQFGPDHEHGSSHGNARIFRLAHPDADYLALARAALPLWDRLEAESGRVLRRRVGGLDHGDPEVVDEISRHLVAADVRHELLDPDHAATRWPGLVVDRRAVFHPDGGTTDAAGTVAAARDLARHHGAALRHQVMVERIEPADDDVTLHLAGAEDPGRLRARFVVVTAGAWAPTLLAGLVPLPAMVVTREQPVHFEFLAAPPAPWPSFIHHTDEGPPRTSGIREPVWGYGLPTPDGRLKLGEHHTGEVVGGTADTLAQPVAPPVDVNRAAVDPPRLARVVAYARRWVPGVDPDSATPERCLYTTTDTADFVLDRSGRLVVAAGFSGHGFKFVPRIGQLLADLVDGGPRPPTRFRFRG